MRLALVMLAALTIAWVAAGSSGEAAFPGHNGKIAFQSTASGAGFDIGLMNPDGSDVTYLNTGAQEGHPAWSADGAKLAFVDGLDNEIYIADADGSNVMLLTSNPALDWYPAWSPDGSKITFQSNRDGNWDVYAINVDGTGVTNLTNDPASDQFPAWSPDGTKIAFAKVGQIYVMNPDGSGQTLVAPGNAPNWSPDGTKIAFTSGGDIFVMNADGTGQTQLTSDPLPDASPAWSADGTRIVFTRNFGLPPGHLFDDEEVFVIDGDGSGETQLTFGTAFDGAPDWQPIPPGVGGIAEFPDVASAPLEAEGSSGLSAGVVAGIVAAVAAGALALGRAAWYARHQWTR